MRYRGLRHLLPLIVIFLASSCDFPADPPLKVIDETINPPVADTAKVLLPLTGAEFWTYVVDPPNRPMSLPRTVSPRRLDREKESFFFLPNIHTPGGSQTIFAFPSLLRNDTLGLGFYLALHPDDTTNLSRIPKHLFTLPYPVRKGTVRRFGDYKVMCTHTDTLMTILYSNLQLPAHRYEIWRGTMPVSRIYAIPGVALLRIDIEELTFHTFGWRL